MGGRGGVEGKKKGRAQWSIAQSCKMVASLADRWRHVRPERIASNLPNEVR